MSRWADPTATGAPNEWLTVAERTHLTRATMGEGLRVLAGHYAFYILTLLGTLAPLPLVVNSLFGLLNGLAIGLLFALGHDCMHNAFVSGRFANRILGRFCFIPCAHSVTQWVVVHNRNHHGRTNLRGVDYVWVPMDLAEFRAASAVRRFLERIYRSGVGPIFYYVIEMWIPRMLFPLTREMRKEWRRHIFDSFFVTLMLGLTIAGVLVTGRALTPDRSLLTILALGWALPYLAWNYVMAISIYLQHTHPDVHWFDDPEQWSFYHGAIAGSIHTETPVPFVRVLASAMGHTAHHALPSIPIYKLPQAQARLIAHYGSEVTKTKFTREYGRILKACKLYDYQHHCWTDFAGKRTGQPMRTAQSAPAPIATEPQHLAAFQIQTRSGI